MSLIMMCEAPSTLTKLLVPLIEQGNTPTLIDIHLHAFLSPGGIVNTPYILVDPCNLAVPNWHLRIPPFQVGGYVLAYPARQQRNVNVPLLAECIKSPHPENPPGNGGQRDQR